ncbi:carboxymuconolactone decarboxylase family protein [Aliivibrio kagoshimensis]|uniref:carboxymuconolactone decarboxylase family protein n=1 Tax=Aliivibrio kagoshimensis TaxID=2910230 RepID=UPI003D0BC7E0
MSWIKTISYEHATGSLRKLYDRIKSPNNGIDNMLTVHSLRPHTMEAHITFSKQLLHHPMNTIPAWFLESIGIYVSYLNGCDYCFEYHYKEMKRVLINQQSGVNYALKIRSALMNHNYDSVFQRKEAAAFDYVLKLTKTPHYINEKDVMALRDKGWKDGEILELNQVSSYFSYANRTVRGLGVRQSS